MSLTGWFFRAPGRLECLALAMTGGLGWAARGQDAPAVEAPAPAVMAPASADPNAPGVAVAAPAVPQLPFDVQVVRFQGPEGLKVEVLGPAPEAVPVGDGKGIATVGLKVGSAYRLRVTDLPDRPGVVLYPIVEIVGHLHRPPGIDPAKFPVRIVFRADDIEDAADRGRLITQVIYLEDPELAVPLKLPKDDPPVVTVSPAEDPFKVARALGRVMAIVRIGGREPTADELAGPSGLGMTGVPCPFVGPMGKPCELPCGPACGTAPPANRPWLPKDEFLCDGGDRGEPVHFAGDGGLAGVDPRDAVVNFNTGDRPRVLPTNVVCVYAPRFATIRGTAGVTEALMIARAGMAELLQRQDYTSLNQGPKKLAQAQTAELNRLRSRATSVGTRVSAGVNAEVRVLGGFDNLTLISGQGQVQQVDKVKLRQKGVALRVKLKADGIKSGEGPVLTGIVEGAGQAVMTWPPREVAGVEVPPKKPGLAVIKQVNAEEAEPGDILTYTIQYRNMGNTPIRAVSITDSLLPRLEYVPQSAKGPAGTVFSFGENKAGSLELRWDLPGAIAPGAEGAVMFQAVVR